jgi:hypothetical protein
VGIWVLCFWVALYQFLLSWAFLPILAVPFIGGSAKGTPLREIPGQLVDGTRCWLGEVDCCQAPPPSNATATSTVQGEVCSDLFGIPPLLLLPLYTLVNFCYNGVGLYVTKHASAVMRSISYSLILPLSTISSAPLFHERISASTFIGLVVVLVGFYFYQHFQELPVVRTARGSSASTVDGGNGDAAQSTLLRDSSPSSKGRNSYGGLSSMAEAQSINISPGSGRLSWQVSFQERLIGMGYAQGMVTAPRVGSLSERKGQDTMGDALLSSSI